MVELSLISSLELEYRSLEAKIKALQIKKALIQKRIYREKFKAKHGMSPETYYRKRK